MIDHDEKLRREAMAEMPAGHYRVREGKIEPDDLIWGWTTKVWLRADDKEWGSHSVLAEDCIYVVRSAAKHRPKGTRTYTVNR